MTLDEIVRAEMAKVLFDIDGGYAMDYGGDKIVEAIVGMVRAASSGLMFEWCVFEGEPPEGFDTWMEWLERGMPYKNVTVRASTVDDWKQKD